MEDSVRSTCRAPGAPDPQRRQRILDLWSELLAEALLARVQMPDRCRAEEQTAEQVTSGQTLSS